MKQFRTMLILQCAMVLVACSNESSLPEATGKGSIRAINAIASAPDIGFLIEERLVGNADFQQITAVEPFDDLEYDFNFEVFFLGDTAITRFATQPLKIVTGTDHVMVLTGTIASPSIILWETPERDFDGSETIFEARFAHLSESSGSVDYYFAAPGVAPVLGEEVGTLNFGEVVTATDFTAGDYVLTVTTSGDPTDIQFESASSSFANSTQYTVTTFDGGANTFAPIIGRAFAVGAGATLTLADGNFPATVEFVNGSLALNTVDIYDDDMQTSRIVDDLAYRDVSAELNLADGENIVHFTPFDMNNPVLIEESINFFRGLRSRVVAFGEVDSLQATSFVPDRRPVVTQAKFQFFNAASNFEFLDVFAIPRDDVLADQPAVLQPLSSGNASTIVALGAGSFDLYVRESGETVNLAGPIQVDTVLGEVYGAVIFDTVDPAVLDMQFLPNNP